MPTQAALDASLKCRWTRDPSLCAFCQPATTHASSNDGLMNSSCRALCPAAPPRGRARRLAGRPWRPLPCRRRGWRRRRRAAGGRDGGARAGAARPQPLAEPRRAQVGVARRQARARGHRNRHRTGGAPPGTRGAPGTPRRGPRRVEDRQLSASSRALHGRPPRAAAPRPKRNKPAPRPL